MYSYGHRLLLGKSGQVRTTPWGHGLPHLWAYILVPLDAGYHPRGP